MIKLTLDTNCIINLLDYKSESATSVDELTEILRYGLDGDVNIAITTKVESDFNNDKAEVKLADGQKFIYVLDGGLEKTLTDLTGITVWKLPAEGTEAAQIKWDGLKAGDKVQIASEKASGQVVAVLVL